MIKVRKEYLKKVIEEELNKELHNNRVPVISDVGLGMFKTAMLQMNYAIVDELEKVNKSQNYNFTEEDILELAHFVIENITKLLPISEGDYDKEQAKKQIDMARSNLKNAQKKKLAVDLDKTREKMNKL